MDPNTLVAAIAFQDMYLDRVSRSFAFTIPQLPDPLRLAVGNAYLICRIADTIEDEMALSMAEKRKFLQDWTAIVASCKGAKPFSRDLRRRLTGSTTRSERDLIDVTSMVIYITSTLGNNQRRAIARCIEIMSEGMYEFQERASLNGLKDISDLDRYCYHVAGVVGEMLTELFCNHSEEIARKHDTLATLAASHGQGLQMTNILKDVWDDHERGVCWLPASVFDSGNFDLSAIAPGMTDPVFQQGMDRLIAIAGKHLSNALKYILCIPSHETGIRRHCLWPVGMAVLTLRRIHANPTFTSGSDVKISRTAVKAVIASTNILTRSDQGLKYLFGHLHRGMPTVSHHDSLAT